MKQIRLENFLKNLLILSVLILSFRPIFSYLHIDFACDTGDKMSFILLLTSAAVVTACFGNFAFSYENINLANTYVRFLSHLTTGLLMLIIGISLEILAAITYCFFPEFEELIYCWPVLYFASVIYDLADLERNAQNKQSV